MWQAGRLPTLDSLAQRYYTADKVARELIYTEAKAAGENASYYLRVMDKLASGAEEWIAKESKRLNGILTKRTMAVSGSTPSMIILLTGKQQSKLDEIKRKANVLAAFLEEKEEAKEAAAEATEKVKDEL